ncbi:Ribosomal protein [Trema orientale]|uniref:Ribosomal protein n=1 Tax=Trema orientale TaxID=63057 RepID=A0A2P5AQ67_TREOI|nr:Ribosomal protein [Trema orientale]
MSSATSIRCKMKLLEFEEDVFEETVDFAEDSLLSEDEKMRETVFHLYDVSTRQECLFRSSNSDTSDENSNQGPLQIKGNHEESSPLHEDENMEEAMSYPSEEYLLYGSNSFTTDEYSNNELLPVCTSNSQDRDPYMDEYSPSNFQLVETEVTAGEDKEESDGFYKMYSERMRWFDLLNYERTCGISAIQNKQSVASSPFKSIELLDSGVVHTSWSKMTQRRLLRSLESDFEKVYVAQSCLSWEALHHQYRKVKELEFYVSKNNLYCSNVAGEFQKFQILLERFMEDEQSEGKRVWNYVQGRFSLRSLLQVPAVSVKGFMENDKEDMKGEGTNLNQVLKAIEECIQAFSVFVKTDNIKNTWWKIRNSSWTYPPVEDPRDLELLAELTKRLQKNKLWLKDLQGKKRCLLKRIVNPLEESQRKEMLFTMTDMNLVSRVLQMSMVSSSQLKWCQEKLDNVEFKDGKVVRACTDSLFPP